MFRVVKMGERKALKFKSILRFRTVLMEALPTFIVAIQVVRPFGGVIAKVKPKRPPWFKAAPRSPDRPVIAL